MSKERPGSGSHPNGEDAGQRVREADDRDARADDREADLSVREAKAEASEGRVSAREQETIEVLAAAEERDARADERDRVADDRESVAALHSFIHDQEYGRALRARRASALDRFDSRTDRTSGASDRAKLSERPPDDTAQAE
jgi:hypothetical protein